MFGKRIISLSKEKCMFLSKEDTQVDRRGNGWDVGTSISFSFVVRSFAEDLWC